MLNKDQVEAYLKRIKFDGPVSHDRDTLDALVLKHQMAVPFETVALHRSERTPSLDIDDIYAKVVSNHGGGYCFELNKAFGALLGSLGFDVRPVLSRAVRGREGRMPINHRGLLVSLDDGVYYVDAGFGGPMPSGALKLESGVDQCINGETYAASRSDDHWWRVERVTRAELDSYDDDVESRRQVELELCVAPVEERDFDSLNEFFSKPGTLFRDHEIVNLRTPDGYLGYKDGVLTVRENGSKVISEIGPDEVDAVLEDVFGLANLGPISL